MCKTMPTFILLFIGYFVKNTHVAATGSDGTTSLLEKSAPYVTEASEPKRAATESETVTTESETVTTEPEAGSDPVPEERLSSVVDALECTGVTGISISLVIILIFVIAFLWFKWKLSKGSSAEINSVPSSEAVVTLKNTKL